MPLRFEFGRGMSIALLELRGFESNVAFSDSNWVTLARLGGCFRERLCGLCLIPICEHHRKFKPWASRRPRAACFATGGTLSGSSTRHNASYDAR